MSLESNGSRYHNNILNINLFQTLERMLAFILSTMDTSFWQNVTARYKNDDSIK